MGEADVTLSQAEEKPPDSGLAPGEDSVVWSHEVEVCLFHAMIGHKPVGVNRHFHMICIRDKFSQNIGRQVSSSVIWDHLGTMYDMQALHESEILPFPNTEKAFSLPDDIIQEVKEGKLGSEEDTKEEFRMEREPPATHEEGLSAVLLFLPLLYAETELHLKPSEDLSSGFCFVGRSCNDGWTYATFSLQRCVRQVDQLCGHDDITSWGTEKSTLTMVYPNCLPFVSHLRE
uniref:MRG/MORF4L binding protein n=1 Tax=Oryzias latipes TaxID=8090 RepID=A0A3B3ICE4_ORYLA